MSTTHSRNVSSDTTSSQTSAYHFILEHILSYPGTYGDLPLRSMYAVNSSAMNKSASGTVTPNASGNGNSPVAASFAQADQRSAMESIVGNLMAEVVKRGRKETSLPPPFIVSFVHKCFPDVLECVDFPQALTALDYLKDLEMRRRKEQAHALQHLGVDRSVLAKATSHEELAKWYPAVQEFLRSLPQREQRADMLYTQLYVALRRWILINEMMLRPFNKNNCHAMLNTLYPPTADSAPTSKLTVAMLQTQREGFFNYVKAVEQRGTSCLNALMMQGARPGERNGWQAVARTLARYLDLATAMIEECQYVSCISNVSSLPQIPTATPHTEVRTPTSPRHEKTDSGVGFVKDGRHSKNASTSSGRSTNSYNSATSTSSVKSQGSTLERIARELRRSIRTSSARKVSIDEIVNSKALPPINTMPKRIEKAEIQPSTPHSAGFDKEGYMLSSMRTTTAPQTPAPRKRAGAIRKMKSLGSLSDLKQSNPNFANGRKGSDTPVFDPDAMRRHREAFERRANIDALI